MFNPGQWKIERESGKRPGGIKGFFYWWLESEENESRYIVDLTVGAVIIFSIVIILAEVTYEPQKISFLIWSNWICLGIFIFEYLLRFWVNTDFIADWSNNSFLTAVKNKFFWMVKPYSVIDLVAILPFGALRTLRTFRFFRLARLLRVFKLARYSEGISGYIKELKKRSYEFTLLGLVVLGILLIGAILIFTIEKPVNEGIETFPDAIWWSVVTMTTVGYGDVYPASPAGRFVAAVLMLTSIGLVGGMGGLITSTIMERIETMREGRVEKIPFEKHIVFCGWTTCAKKVSETLASSGILDEKKLVVLTENERPDEDYLIAVSGDFSKPDKLKVVNAAKADFVIIFHETSKYVDEIMADRKAMITALQVESMNQKVHTVTELFDISNAGMVTDTLHGDEVVPKEDVDADLIINTIQNLGHTTKMFYNLSDFSDQRIMVSPPGQYFYGSDLPVSVKEFRKKLIEDDRREILLGLLDGEGEIDLNPSNETDITEDMNLYIIKESTGWI